MKINEIKAYAILSMNLKMLKETNTKQASLENFRTEVTGTLWLKTRGLSGEA